MAGCKVGTRYETHREKSSSETVTANLTETEQRVRTLSDQIRVLNDQHTRQINANARELQALGIQIQTLESRAAASALGTK
jgi:TolA-binding protein